MYVGAFCLKYSLEAPKIFVANKHATDLCDDSISSHSFPLIYVLINTAHSINKGIGNVRAKPRDSDDGNKIFVLS